MLVSCFPPERRPDKGVTSFLRFQFRTPYHPLGPCAAHRCGVAARAKPTTSPSVRQRQPCRAADDTV